MPANHPDGTSTLTAGVRSHAEMAAFDLQLDIRCRGKHE